MVDLAEKLEIEESLRLYYQQELEQIQQSKDKKMNHIIALGTLTATAGAVSLAFPPAGLAFGLFVLGAGLFAKGE